ncbi:MAG: hypothetical protein ABIH99_03510 [Candidatus Micrarchaeota archaeon]
MAPRFFSRRTLNPSSVNTSSANQLQRKKGFFKYALTAVFTLPFIFATTLTEPLISTASALEKAKQKAKLEQKEQIPQRFIEEAKQYFTKRNSAYYWNPPPPPSAETLEAFAFLLFKMQLNPEREGVAEILLGIASGEQRNYLPKIAEFLSKFNTRPKLAKALAEGLHFHCDSGYRLKTFPALLEVLSSQDAFLLFLSYKHKPECAKTIIQDLGEMLRTLENESAAEDALKCLLKYSKLPEVAVFITTQLKEAAWQVLRTETPASFHPARISNFKKFLAQFDSKEVVDCIMHFEINPFAAYALTEELSTLILFSKDRKSAQAVAQIISSSHLVYVCVSKLNDFPEAGAVFMKLLFKVARETESTKTLNSFAQFFCSQSICDCLSLFSSNQKLSKSIAELLCTRMKIGTRSIPSEKDVSDLLTLFSGLGESHEVAEALASHLVWLNKHSDLEHAKELTASFSSGAFKGLLITFKDAPEESVRITSSLAKVRFYAENEMLFNTAILCLSKYEVKQAVEVAHSFEKITETLRDPRLLAAAVGCYFRYKDNPELASSISSIINKLLTDSDSRSQEFLTIALKSLSQISASSAGGEAVWLMDNLIAECWYYLRGSLSNEAKIEELVNWLSSKENLLFLEENQDSWQYIRKYISRWISSFDFFHWSSETKSERLEREERVRTYIQDALDSFDTLRRSGGFKFFKTLEDHYGITCFRRYPFPALQELHNNINRRQTEKPLFVMALAKQDLPRSGLPVGDENEFLANLTGILDMRLMEAGSDTDFLKYARKMHETYGKFDSLLISGHGNLKGISLGSREDDAGYLSFEDASLFTELNAMMKPNAFVILFSCSTGNSYGDKIANEAGETISGYWIMSIAQRISQLMPNALVFAPREDVSGVDVQTDAKGIKSLQFRFGECFWFRGLSDTNYEHSAVYFRGADITEEAKENPRAFLDAQLAGETEPKK